MPPARQSSVARRRRQTTTPAATRLHNPATDERLRNCPHLLQLSSSPVRLKRIGAQHKCSYRVLALSVVGILADIYAKYLARLRPERCWTWERGRGSAEPHLVAVEVVDRQERLARVSTECVRVV